MGLGMIRKDVEALVELSRKMPSNSKPEKAGGFFFSGVNGLTHNIFTPIGNYDPKKEEAYASFAQEKAYRLYADWLRDSTSISSWQTRQPEINGWGGAVLFNYLIPVGFPLDAYMDACPSCAIYSFSGLTEEADEAVSLAYGYFGREVPPDWQKIARESRLAERVIEISDNQIAREMFEVLERMALPSK
jgi:hypothetical protein